LCDSEALRYRRSPVLHDYTIIPLSSLWGENKRRAFFHIVLLPQLKGFATKSRRFKYFLARVMEEGYRSSITLMRE
jgi:hypothetical protein